MSDRFWFVIAVIIIIAMIVILGKGIIQGYLHRVELRDWLLRSIYFLIRSVLVDIPWTPTLSKSKPVLPRERWSLEQVVRKQYAELMDIFKRKPDPTVHLRLDATLPSQVECGRSFRLVIAIRHLDSPKLEIEKLDQVVSDEEMHVVWPAEADSIALRVHVSAPECAIDRNSRPYRLYRGRDSRPLFFQLTPQQTGDISIVVTVYQEMEPLQKENWLGDVPLDTVAQARLAGEIKLNVISQEVMPSREAQVAVAQHIEQLFDVSDLKTLCFDLDVLYGNLPGEILAEKSRSLVTYMVNRGRFHELVRACQEQRDKVDWEALAGIVPAEGDMK